jgi:ATP-dependent RNA helicase SUPV3L1/SUV3
VTESTRLSCLLGPTNTGKTHRAVERMLEHPDGMIGLPLRLLAREVYDRITARIGESRVALVTGEEKRIPDSPRYWVCTVEAMPLDREVEFLAVDEIQLAGHRERGHVFTDRLLHARGKSETWFLGSDTIEPLVRALLPHADVQRHPRLSRLSFAGGLTIGKLPPRSAVVAFSMSRVYELAELLTRRVGGAAVVVGALSPRARNAQVAMYQAGEVDYLVATDAIGMGLNLNLEHVVFADASKFDGAESRPLEPAELGQIAGRAGRYKTDGSFATLAPLPPLSERVAHAVEIQRFQPLRRLWWRNSDLDFGSVDALVDSLGRPPKLRALTLVPYADDYRALTTLAAHPDVRARATSTERVQRLWEVCQIPDYRKLLSDAHAKLVSRIFLDLTGPRGSIDRDWVAAEIQRLDDTAGDIDVLLGRMAAVRTWTYVSNHAGWLENSRELGAVASGIEDRLSDTLHTRLVERFVERGSRRRARPAQVSHDHPFHSLGALRSRLAPEKDEASELEALAEAPHEDFSVEASGKITVRGTHVGRLIRGSDLLHPEVRVELDSLSAGARSRMTRRLVAFARDLVFALFRPLREAPSLSAAARGLAYQIEVGLGTVLSSTASAQLHALSSADRQALGELGVTLGRVLVYADWLLVPRALRERAALSSAFHGGKLDLPFRPSTVSLRVTDSSLEARLMTLGYPLFGSRAVRADIAERVARGIHDGTKQRAELGSLLGCPQAELDRVLSALGAPPAPQKARRQRPRSRAAT